MHSIAVLGRNMPTCMQLFIAGRDVHAWMLQYIYVFALRARCMSLPARLLHPVCLVHLNYRGVSEQWSDPRE